MKVKVTQSCPTLWDSEWLYSPWNSPRQYTGVSSLSLLQGIIPSQGSNPDLLHCRWILYQLSHKGSPQTLEWVACPFTRGSSWPRNQTRVSCIAGGFFTNWSIRKAPAWGIHRPKERSQASVGKGLHVSASLWLPRQSLEIPPLNSSPSQPGAEPGTSAWALALNLVISLCLCFLF